MLDAKSILEQRIYCGLNLPIITRAQSFGGHLYGFSVGHSKIPLFFSGMLRKIKAVK